jgi:hypothetical protein
MRTRTTARLGCGFCLKKKLGSQALPTHLRLKGHHIDHKPAPISQSDQSAQERSLIVHHPDSQRLGIWAINGRDTLIVRAEEGLKILAIA